MFKQKLNTSMKRAVNGLLGRSFVRRELDPDYFRTCSGYAISAEGVVYQVEANDDLDFNIAALAFVKEKEREKSVTPTICIFATDVMYRNKGFGGMLLEAIVEIYGDMNLCVRVSNKHAIKLYKSKGFVIVEQLKDFYNYTGINEDAYRMIRRLDGNVVELVIPEEITPNESITKGLESSKENSKDIVQEDKISEQKHDKV